MPRKERDPPADDEDRLIQVNVKIPSDLVHRLAAAAKMLATDRSHLLRLMIAEKLPEYEERGRKARGIKPDDPAKDTFTDSTAD